MFELSKPSPTGDSSHTNVKATFRNTGPSDITGLHFQAAVPKYIKLEMQPATGSLVPANGAAMVEQVIRLTNSMQACGIEGGCGFCQHGQKNLMLKIKLEFKRGGEKVQEMASVSNFPPGY
ncbi:unnamed protein product [Discosporangium mesarthrocarpum]